MMHSHRTIPALLLFIAICGIIYLANSGSDNVVFEAVQATPFGDKLGHAILFGGLAFLANRAFSCRFVRNRWLQVGSLSVTAFALFEELTQHFNPNRTLDGFDAAADLVGIGVATWLSIRTKRDALTTQS